MDRITAQSKPQSAKLWDSWGRYDEIQGKGTEMMPGKSFPEDGRCEEVMPNSSVFLTDWDVSVESDLAIFKNTANHT